ncbi:MAG: T9SS type A sorting domain-containing protein [Ferruginibacter sp.]
MWNFAPKLTFILSVFILCTHAAEAQTEYLVTVNPLNANISKIDSLQDVRWIQADPAYNEFTKSFTFIGLYQSNQAPVYLYTINALTGAVMSNPAIPVNNNISHLKYSKSSGKLYGIIYNYSTNMFSLVEVNTNTGNYVILRDFPGYTLYDFTIDEINQRMFIRARNNISGSNFYIYTIDLVSVNIISQVATSTCAAIQYDNITHKIYCISPGNSQVTLRIATVNELTGIVSPIADIPSVQGMRAGAHQTFDEVQHLYYFVGNNSNMAGEFLYAIDVNTGAAVSSPLIPASDSGLDYDNLIFFRYDNISEKMYAMFWEARTIHEPPPIVIDTSAIIDSTCNLKLVTKVYTNPYSHRLVIDKGATLCKVSLNIYNMLGQVILKGKIINDGHNEIEFSNFSTGIYFYKFISNGKTLLTGRFLK